MYCACCVEVDTVASQKAQKTNPQRALRHPRYLAKRFQTLRLTGGHKSSKATQEATEYTVCIYVEQIITSMPGAIEDFQYLLLAAEEPVAWKGY